MPTLILEHGPRPGSTGILGETLREYGHRITFVHLAPESGAAESLPGDLDDVDALVLSDGPQALGGQAPSFLAAETALVRDAHAKQIPIVGLGFGARVLAHALGGELAPTVAKGWLNLRLTFVGHEDPIYAGVPWVYPQPLDQSESIAKLPPGGISFAESAAADGRPQVRAFSAGVFAYGFEHQWWLNDRLVELMGGAGDERRTAWRTHGATSMRLGRRMAESVALYLMPVDQANRGRVKDLHY